MGVVTNVAPVFDFDIHLESGNSFLGTGDFEIHIARKIFYTLNIGENFVSLEFGFVVFVCNKTHSDTSDWSLDRHTRIHK